MKQAIRIEAIAGRLGRARRRVGEWLGLAAAYSLLALILVFGREPGDPPDEDDH